MFYEQMISSRLGGENFYKNSYYKFEHYAKIKQNYRKKHPDSKIIDFGIGESEQMPSNTIRQELKRQIDVYENRIYADNGIEDLKDAILLHLKEIYHLSNIKRENINHVMGAKSALCIIPMAFVDNDDIIIATTPGYDVGPNFSKWLNGQVYYVPLLEKNNFLVDLDSIPEDILKKTKLFFINYPNSPTGATATLTFYEKLISFSKKYHFLIVNDAVYGTLSAQPLSIFQVKDAMDYCIEVHSFSKAFHMTGMRIGFVLANPTIIHILKMVKDNMDSGQYIPIQYAAMQAIREEKESLPILYKHYQTRKKRIVEILNRHGIFCKISEATFYLYVKVPPSFYTANDFCLYLLENYQIFTLPWDEVEPYVRLSMTYLCENEEEFYFELDKRLSWQNEKNTL